MKVAVVHDWLSVYSGAEKALEQILDLFPEADVFALFDFLENEQRGFLKGRNIHTSFLQNLPFCRDRYRLFLPLMPIAIEQFDFSDYDLVISSSHAVAKGVITGPKQLHISYVHSPIRYAWDLQGQYLQESNLTKGVKSWLVRWFLHKIRIWDYRTGAGVDQFVANSGFIAKRIEKIYRRGSKVIHPPVNTERFQLFEDKKDYYVTAQRMVPYKKVPLIVEAFNQMPDKKLLILGDGPDMAKVRKTALSNNIRILGYQSHDSLMKYIQQAKAFVFAAEEDFGIAPVEAQACGTPVIAYGEGGALETVEDGKTGVFFKQQTVDSIVEAVNRFERDGVQFNATEIRATALKFSEQQFKQAFVNLVNDKLVERGLPGLLNP